MPQVSLRVREWGDMVWSISTDSMKSKVLILEIYEDGLCFISANCKTVHNPVNVCNSWIEQCKPNEIIIDMYDDALGNAKH